MNFQKGDMVCGASDSPRNLFLCVHLRLRFCGICKDKEILRYLILVIITLSGKIKDLASHDAQPSTWEEKQFLIHVHISFQTM